MNSVTLYPFVNGDIALRGLAVSLIIIILISYIAWNPFHAPSDRGDPDQPSVADIALLQNNQKEWDNQIAECNSNGEDGASFHVL